MPALYLNTYRPLAATRAGRAASLQHHLPPFIDGSIRREPDLAHQRPSISCLCRGGQFAPRLRVGDHVVYMTCMSPLGASARQQRLTAVLRVDHVLNTHAEGAAWYGQRGLPLPSNCMVSGNPPEPLDHSHRRTKHRCDDGKACGWDAGYRQRAAQHGAFIITTALWRDLDWSAPTVHREALLKVFGRVPGTRNPGPLPLKTLATLLKHLAIHAAPSCP